MDRAWGPATDALKHVNMCWLGAHRLFPALLKLESLRG